ncbi:MAG: sterol desaturase family protein, partial [Planctomycetes bacterium]|nr:sterol desaturase family protein [Planctomycetota bacterium]
RAVGFVPPRLEQIVPWLNDNALASFLVYFVLYDFAAYWLHRAQHKFSWWWTLHSLHHSQRQVTVWNDDRNHIVDDLLMTLALALFSQFVGVQPGDYILILMVGRLVESWSHANVDMSFGRVGEKLLVGPRFHRLHHALASPAERHIHDHNFAPVFPIWDILFGTAIYDGKHRPTGVDDPAVASTVSRMFGAPAVNRSHAEFTPGTGGPGGGFSRHGKIGSAGLVVVIPRLTSWAELHARLIAPAHSS